MMAIDYRFSKRLADAGATSDHARQANLATWCASANYSTFVVSYYEQQRSMWNTILPGVSRLTQQGSKSRSVGEFQR